MQSATPSISQRFWELPRAARWLAFAVVFTLCFLSWDKFVRPVAADWNRSADAIEDQVRQVRDSSATANLLRQMRDPIVAIGYVAYPGTEDQGRVGLTEAVTEVMKGKGYSFNLSGSGGRLPPDVSREITDQGKRLTRLTGELKFDATPKEAIEYIAAFEVRDDIESVSSVRLKKSSGGKVTVRLTLDAWVEVEKKSR